MPTTITGTDGVSQVQAGVIQSDDLAAGVGGKVLQVVQATDSVSTDYSSATPVEKVSLNITPSSTLNKILLLYIGSEARAVGGSRVFANSFFYRNGSEILQFTDEMGKDIAQQKFTISGTMIDSPSSTASITYAVFHAAPDDTWRISHVGMPSVLTAMEIAG